MKNQADFQFNLGVNTLFLVPGDVGGTETYLREMLLAMVKVRPLMTLTLFTNQENDSYFKKLFAEFPNVYYKCLNFKAAIRPLRIFVEQLFLPLFVWKSNIDILWSPGYTTPFWSRCPQVTTIHDLQYKLHPEDLTFLERKTLDFLVRIACRKSRGIIAVSNFSKNEIINYQFAPDRKIFVVREGVEKSFSIKETDKRVLQEARFLFPLDVPYILCVAHTYPHKKVHTLVEAFNSLLHKIPHNLVLVGKPRLGEYEMSKSIHTLKDKSRVFRLTEGVSSPLLKLLYQQADMFVLPSIYEGFGLPVLEAMMSGTPVIITRMASLPEVGGTHAFYVDELSDESLAQQILAMINLSENEKRSMIEGAKRWAESFSWEAAATETLQIFGEIYRKFAA